MNRKQKIIFIISLSFNALIILLLIASGIKVAYLYKNGYKSPHGISSKVIREIYQDENIQNELIGLKVYLDDFEGYLTNDHFEHDTALKHLDKIDGQLKNIHKNVNNHIIATLATMPPDMRVNLFRKMMRPKLDASFQKKKKRYRKHDDDDDDDHDDDDD